METVLIASTPTQGIRPIGGSGQRSHALLVRTLKAHLGSNAAALFAEPVPSPDGVSIDWYAAAQGEPVRFDRLDEADRSALKARFEDILRQIEGLADRLEASASEDDIAAARRLRQALRFPDESYLYKADDRLVVTAWAHEFEDGTRPSSDLSAWIDRTPAAAITPVAGAAPPPPAGPEAAAPAAAVLASTGTGVAAARPGGLGWLLDLLLWLVLTVLLVLIFLRLLPACELRWLASLGVLTGCPVAVVEASDLPVEQARGDLLEDEIARLQRELAERRYECRVARLRPPAVPVEPPEDAAPGPDDGSRAPGDEPAGPQDREFDERMERENATRGDLTFTLIWSTTDDLDLHVTCPSGDIVSHQRRSACGGQLDTDANGSGNAVTRSPVENVFWPAGNLESGVYAVGVDLYGRRETPPGTPVAFSLRVVNGEESRIVNGEISNQGQVMPVTTVPMP